MNISEYMKDFNLRDICRNCFTVDVIGSDILSFICIFYHGEWIVFSKATERIIYWCRSRLDCIRMINYSYGLPF